MTEYVITVDENDERWHYVEQQYTHFFGYPITEEIVRCRDCVKWDYDSTYPKKACFEFSNPEDGYIVATSPDGYCKWGEKR